MQNQANLFCIVLVLVHVNRKEKHYLQTDHHVLGVLTVIPRMTGAMHPAAPSFHKVLRRPTSQSAECPCEPVSHAL